MLAITDAPVLRNPPNGTLLQNMGAITLSFELPAGTTQYHIRLIPFNGDGPGANLIRNPESSFTLLPPTLGVGPYVILPGMTYTWRLRATNKPAFAPENDPSWGPWTDPFSFTTPPPSADSIRPTNPPIGVTVTSLNPTLTWSDDNPFIFYYEIDVAKDRLFDRVNPIGPIFSNFVHGGESRPFNSWVVPASFPLEPGCTYYWRVRPRVQGNGTPVNWGLPFSFKAPSRSADDCKPGSSSGGGGGGGGGTGGGGSGPFTLIVTSAGTGSGTVTSLPQGINCGIDCSEAYAKGTVVTLSATPKAGSKFTGWAGDADCSDGVVTMNATTSCIVIFDGDPTPAPTGTFTLIVTVEAGNGTVKSFPVGINCAPICSATFAAGTVVTLTATPLSGNEFIGWSGDPDCSDGTVTMNAPTSCRAAFRGGPGDSAVLTINKTGTGSGTVLSNPQGITCGPVCTASFPRNSTVQLTTAPDAGSRFVAWSGAADCATGQVMMDTNKTCTAFFDGPTPTPTPVVSQPPTNTPTPSATPTATSTPTPTRTPTPVNAVFTIRNDGSTGSLICQSDAYPCDRTPNVQSPEGANKVCSDSTSNFQVCRAFLSFDTSSIPASATILSATLEFSHGGGSFLSQDGTTLEIVSASQGTALASDDWNRIGSSSFASRAVSSLQASGLNTIALNSGGISAIARGGTTQFGLRLGLDMQGQKPNGQNQINLDMTTGGSLGVKLKVMYRL